MFRKQILAALLIAARLNAQSTKSATDSAKTDSAAAQRLAGVRVSVARSDQSAQRAPWAIGVQTKADLSGARATLGIDEALPNIPGVYVANRYNYALDQRLSIRGAGARANFGLRGVKVLLDGVPQSLPDGQSQLTNIDLADIARVEVLRGSASSLYGNGSGGVISMTTDLSSPDRLGMTARYTGGSFGLSKYQLRSAGRTGDLVGSLSLSRTTVDGFRQYSRGDTRQLMGALDYALSANDALSLRVGAAATPTAENPGALTAAEYAKNPDSAAAVNVQRGASRAVSQEQLSLRYHHADARSDYAAVAYVQRRLVDNPLATSPPAPTGALNGMRSTLSRWVTGVRLDGSRTLWDAPTAPRLAVGADFQQSGDLRRNQRNTAGKIQAATDTLLVNQNEIVSAIGAFSQLLWSPLAPLTVSAGLRYDDLTFQVRDHFFGDKADNSGTRAMSATTGHLGATWVVNDALTPYATWSTAFESPTTTELSSRPDGQGGFNPDLGPQRIHTIEGGARGALGARTSYTLSVFQSYADDAIIQYLETNGRAYFRNAGRTRNRGIEAGAGVRAASWLDLSAAYTWANYIFDRYRVQRGAVTDTLDGKTQAGIPEHFLRLIARAHWGNYTLDADHTRSTALWADDRNTQRIPGWGRGVVNLRAAWSGAFTGAWRDVRVMPFAAVNNLLDEHYVGAVTLNGAGARTIEPAPRRNFYFGLEMGWRAVR
jgi:iron complex outermembrane receptor protein